MIWAQTFKTSSQRVKPEVWDLELELVLIWSLDPHRSIESIHKITGSLLPLENNYSFSGFIFDVACSFVYVNIETGFKPVLFNHVINIMFSCILSPDIECPFNPLAPLPFPQAVIFSSQIFFAHSFLLFLIFFDSRMMPLIFCCSRSLYWYTCCAMLCPGLYPCWYSLFKSTLFSL